MNQTYESMGDITTLPAIQDARRNAAVRLPAVAAGFFDLQSFELMQRVAKGFAASSLVPKIYQGGTAEAIGNCMIALNLAKRVGGDPLMVMQNLAVVHGRPSWSSQFLIASVNTCGRFTALRFEFFGQKGLDNWGCRAWATEKSTGEKLTGPDIDVALAKKEGWFGRNGSKWQTITQKMLMYRAGAWWTHVYAPELSMGLMTADEVEDVIDLAPEAYSRVIPEEKKPQTISSRLDQFVSGAEPDQQPDPAPADDINQDPTPEPEAKPPHSAASAASASSEPQPPSEPEGADATELPENIRDAVARGRGARRDKFPREVPKGYHYKSRQAEADAFLRGWDDENAKMNVEEFGMAE